MNPSYDDKIANYYKYKEDKTNNTNYEIIAEDKKGLDIDYIKCSF